MFKFQNQHFNSLPFLFNWRNFQFKRKIRQLKFQNQQSQKNQRKFLILFLTIIFLFAQNSLSAQVKHNPWELIIYRPENSFHINDVRCFLKIQDENGNDVSKSKVSATYEWISNPDVINQFEKSYYLSGGMAVHLQLQKGKYRFSVYTPKSELVYFLGNPRLKEFEWQSNVFEYDTENPAKVIFVVPQADSNGFYNGNWLIDYKAPKWFKFTKPKLE